VEFLALFGCPFPTFFRPWPQSRRWLVHQFRRFSKHVRVLVGQPWRDGLTYLRAKLAGFEVPLDPVLVLRTRVGRAATTAVRRYSPQPFDGRICLFLPSRGWARAEFAGQRWKGLSQTTDEYWGPEGCTNLTMLLPENAPVFARLFRRACRNGKQRSKAP
jgi:hypothetical protein